MTNAKLPDALRLSGLRGSINLLNLHNFVGRIRRSRRIRHKLSALCQQSSPMASPSGLFLFTLLRRQMLHRLRDTTFNHRTASIVGR
ncbi:hypothetical protein L670_19175 [Escherichia coli NCTC 50110]|nr:hypothetical protein C201_10062 [Escherichia coli S17]KGL68412.1 hypothetical protein L670_19175 [Escherichia coli NCTC 50110]KRR51625.1 hypothetical protein EC2874_22786 [Escherichia coli VL2874]KRR55541.1 hypothetical protein EC2732_02780 [Escherichia coli VL2732]CUQ97303.1 hypothetical protein BN1843_26340 [Escherichia coli]